MDKLNNSGPALEQITNIHGFINKLAYVLGTEFTNTWYFNKRSFTTLIVITTVTWLLWYSAYVEYPDLKCVELLGGQALSSTVKHLTKKIQFKNCDGLIFSLGSR